MKTTIRIVSDSLLIRNTLEQAFAAEFSIVQTFANAEDALGPVINPNTVVLLEVGDADACHKLIEEAIETGVMLSNVILLLRDDGQADEMGPLIGVVGAILSPAVALEHIVRLSQLLSEGICIIPANLARTRRRASTGATMRRKSLTVLSERERTVLSHLSTGDCDKEIAATLAISDSTVRFHVRSIMRKLGTQNRIQTALMVFDY